MKTLLTVLCILLLTSAAFAAKPVIENNGPALSRIECPFEAIAFEWDFNTGDHGFLPQSCDPTGGDPVWAYGTDANFPGLNLWGTVLDGDYPANAGEALVSPTFAVDASTSLLQIIHYYDTEFSYDGLNVMVGDVVIEPMAGYDDDILSDSASYYAFCVDGQPGFSGHDLDDYVLITSCFDLAQFDGQDVALSLQFGSDSSISYPGWYLSSIVVGGTQPVATEPSSWTGVKAMYR